LSYLSVYPINPATNVKIPPAKLLNIIIIIPTTTSNIQFKGTGLSGLITASKIITAKIIAITRVIILELSKFLSLNPYIASINATPPPMPASNLIKSSFLIFFLSLYIDYLINLDLN